MKPNEIKEAIEKLVERGKHTLLLIGNIDSSAMDRFISEYTVWYSEALPVIRAFLPDRLAELESLYASSASVDPSMYSIQDYLTRARSLITPSNSTWFKQASEAASAKFLTQISMLDSVRSRLDSILADIKGVLQADLFDSELDAARDLLQNGHLRASGVVAGVVLEGHIRKVCLGHGLQIGKNPTISTLNDLLKDNGIIDLPQWRRIQHLGDLRNLCGHKRDREPTDEDVGELLDGVDKVIKTIF